MFGGYDKKHYACICRRCGELCIKDKSVDPDEYECGLCFSHDLLITSMTPSEAQREKQARNWKRVLARYFTEEEIANMEAQTYAATPDTAPRSTKKPLAEPECVPTCPTCKSQNVEKIGNLNRAASITLWGIFSTKINKQFVCKNCGYKW